MGNQDKEKDIINLLKSGNFTIGYYDNGCCSLYEGKYEYEDLPENIKEICGFDCESEGYLPKEVQLLIKALGGKSGSI